MLLTSPLGPDDDEVVAMPRREGSLSVASVLRNKTLLAFLLLSEVWLLVGSLWVWWWTVEDAFIGYRYAQNLARGAGLVLNKCERDEGYSNFLWLLLLAGAVAIGEGSTPLPRACATRTGVSRRWGQRRSRRGSPR